MLRAPHRDRLATIVGAYWDTAGPPVRYAVLPDARPSRIISAPDDLVILAGTRLP